MSALSRGQPAVARQHVDAAYSRPDRREPQRGVDHGESAAHEQDAFDVLMRRCAEIPGATHITTRACDARKLGQAGGRRIAERQDNLVRVQRAAIVEPHVPAAVASARELERLRAQVREPRVRGRRNLRFGEARPQILAIHLPG